jgi:hypothetical protein
MEFQITNIDISSVQGSYEFENILHEIFLKLIPNFHDISIVSTVKAAPKTSTSSSFILSFLLGLFQNPVMQDVRSIKLTVNITLTIPDYDKPNLGEKPRNQFDSIQMVSAFNKTKDELLLVMSKGERSLFQAQFDSLAQYKSFPNIKLAEISPVLPKTFVTVHLHTPRPTSQPTSMPTCDEGSFAKNMNGTEYNGYGHKLKLPLHCTKCPRGTYTSIGDQVYCIPCPIGFYSDELGLSECKSCLAFYPRYSTHRGMAYCNGYYLQVERYPIVYYFLIPIIITGMLGGFKLAEHKFWHILLWAFVPTYDVVTDFFVIIGTPFENFGYFLSIIIFFNTSTIGFACKLYEMKCKCWIFDLFVPERLQNTTDPFSFLFYVLYCIILMFITVFPFIWLLFGALLFQTKLLAINKVYDMWFGIWTGGITFNQKKNIEVDSELLNESFFSQLISETIPQLILQNMNVVATGGGYSTINILSIFFSCFTALSGLYTFGYHKVLINNSMSSTPN